MVRASKSPVATESALMKIVFNASGISQPQKSASKRGATIEDLQTSLGNY
jgi:hypothetical protein